MKLAPLDVHCLSAADGWLDLGDWKSAITELDQISAGGREHPAVLAMRFRAYSAGGQWGLALRSAEAGLAANTEDAQAWIHRSFALHELKRTREAEELLLPALDKFPSESIIAYNLACYACVQGELLKARALLERAAAVGNPKELRRMALEDPDLAALRSEIQKS
jgi:Flp pilus assembly protein TadD